jgi:hypothetical protein
MITTDDLSRMVVEIMTGQEPSRLDEESMRAWNQLKAECDEIKRKGGVVEIPGEIPKVD